jgi:serine/threonine protein kinase
MNKYNIIDEIGKGLYGTTYEVEYNNKRFALKKQKILEKDLKKNLHSSIWREFDFYKWVDKLDKKDQIFFMKLYDNFFEDNCKLNQIRNIKSTYEFRELDKSKHCINLVLDLKEGTINKINLHLDQKISLLIQILYIIYLLRKDNWMHRDIHPGNIAYTKVDKYTQIEIKINKKKYKINTHGYIFSLIDYGSCINKKHLKNKYEKKEFNKGFNMNFDLWCFIEDYCLNNYENGITLRENKFNTKNFHRNLINHIYKTNKMLYEKIKFIMINSDIMQQNLFLNFEKNNKYDDILLYNFSQYVQIYETEIYYEFLKINIRDNKYPKEILEFIKINYDKLDKLITILIKS